MTPAQIYAAVRTRLVDLAASADPDVPVPALPGWTVKDAYAHLAGICADVLSGRLTGMPDDEWTAGQVAERAGASLAEICAEWTGMAEAVGEALQRRRTWLMVQDVWQHEQDVRGALGLPGDRGEEVCTWMAGYTLDYKNMMWPPELPGVDVLAARRSWRLGPEPADLTLRAEPYELARALIGRRSRRQFAAMDWTTGPAGGGGGDRPTAETVDEVVSALHVFPMAERDLVD